MRWGTTAALVWLAIAAAGTASAQPVRTRILEGLSIDERERGWSMRVGFTSPVRYLRHAPEERGRFVHVQLELIRVGAVDLVPSFGRESLRAPVESGAPLVEIVYDGSGAEGPALDLRFSRDVSFSVHQGNDFRSLRIDVVDDRSQRITPPRPPEPEPHAAPATPVAPSETEPQRGPPEVGVDLDHPFALELDAAPRDAEFPALPALAAFRRYRVYVIETTRNGAPWKSRRLGFFPDASSAKETAALLAPRFPGVSVLKVSRAERLISEAVAVSPPPSPIPIRARSKATDEEVEAVRVLVNSAREALIANDLDAAIRLLTKASTYPETPYAAEAKELLGIARERNGQLAHAKAEYQEYLAAYPDGEGAERVRQRLQALVTQRAEPREELRAAQSSRAGEWDLRGYGSGSVTYFRNELFQETVKDLADDTAIADLNGVARLRAGDIDAEARLAGDYRIDNPFQELHDDVRLSTLFAAASDRALGLDGNIGRQSINTGGVLGRFDGGGLGFTFLDGWRIGSVAGYPVDFGRDVSIDTDRRFVGVSLNSPNLFDVVNGQIWALGQRIDGHTDRTAVGAELHYVANGRFAAAFVDYDIHFQDLNSALLVASSPLGWETEANLFLDYRYSPPLTTGNALLGEFVPSLNALHQIYSWSEIEDLARDRSARTSTGTLSLTKHLTETVQITADGTLSEVDDLPASGALPPIEGTGLEYQVGLQLLSSSLIRDGDIAVVSARYFDGGFSDSYGGSLNWRVPVTQSVRLNPRLDTDYRRIPHASDALFLRPTLRLDWRVWHFTLDAEAGFEWVRRSRSAHDEYGYLTRLSLRWDYP